MDARSDRDLAEEFRIVERNRRLGAQLAAQRPHVIPWWAAVLGVSLIISGLALAMHLVAYLR